MTSATIANIILDAFVLMSMLSLLGWAIRTQWRDLPSSAAASAERRRGSDRRRARAERHRPAHAERRRGDRRYGGAVTAS